MDDELIIHVMKGDMFRKRFPTDDPCSIGIIITASDIMVLPLDVDPPFSCSTKRYQLMQERVGWEKEARSYKIRQRYGKAARWNDLDSSEEVVKTVASYEERINDIDKQLSNEPEEPYLGRIMYEWFIDNADRVIVGHENYEDY